MTYGIKLFQIEANSRENEALANVLQERPVTDALGYKLEVSALCEKFTSSFQVHQLLRKKAMLMVINQECAYYNFLQQKIIIPADMARTYFRRLQITR